MRADKWESVISVPLQEISLKCFSNNYNCRSITNSSQRELTVSIFNRSSPSLLVWRSLTQFLWTWKHQTSWVSLLELLPLWLRREHRDHRWCLQTRPDWTRSTAIEAPSGFRCRAEVFPRCCETSLGTRGASNMWSARCLKRSGSVVKENKCDIVDAIQCMCQSDNDLKCDQNSPFVSR